MCKVSISLTDLLRLYSNFSRPDIISWSARPCSEETFIRSGVDAVFEKWMDRASVLNLYSPGITEFKINRFRSYAVK